jgi:DNA polymerase iota
MIKYNIALLNPHDLARSFFMLDKDDPTKGFSFDANCYEGPTEANDSSDLFAYDHDLTLRLKLGSHLASHIRKELERQTGYTSTVGVSTSKLLSKLVGNLHKPKDQTTLMPPYVNRAGRIGNVEPFISDYEIGKIPGIGSKLAQKIRQHILQHEPDFEKGLIYGETKERVTVRDVRLAPGMSSETLEKILAGPGSPYGIGDKIWSLLHGVDDSEVNFAKAVPNQISIEDSYIRLDTLPEVYRELKMLSCSLIERMRVDLVTVSDDAHTLADSAKNEEQSSSKSSGRWLAQPKTIRLSTRPRLPLNPDGTRTRSFKRISHSATMPNFALSLTDPIDALAEKLVHETLIAMFRKLHPEKAGWNLSLVNIAVTNMVETGGESRTAKGRDIGSMFRRQETVHKEFRISDGAEEEGIEPLLEQKPQTGFTEPTSGAETRPSVDTTAFEPGDGWVDDEDMAEDDETCGVCGMLVPLFAMSAHARFHQAS